MQLKSLELAGLTVFEGEQSIDFGTIPHGLVAIIGRNGEGKTTLLESIFAALYRELPSRTSPITKYCNRPDANIRLRFSLNGSEIDSRLLIDAKRNKMEAYLYRDGGPVEGSNGKVTVFDAAVEQTIGSRSLMLSSAFSAQNRAGNFLEMKVGSRTELMIELLGLGHLPGKEQVAKQRAADALERTGKARLERDHAKAGLVRLDEVRTKLDLCRTELSELEAVVDGRTKAGDLIQSELDEARRRLAKADGELIAEQSGLADQVRTHREDLADIENRMVARDAALKVGEAHNLETVNTLKVKLRETRSRMQDLTVLIDQRDAVTQAGVDLERLEAEIPKLEAERDSAFAVGEKADKLRHEYELASGTRSTAVKTVERLRTECAELSEVPCHAEPPYDQCPKILRSAQALKDLPGAEYRAEELTEERNRIGDELNSLPDPIPDYGGLEADLQARRREQTRLIKLAAERPALEHAEERVAELMTSVGEMEERLKELASPPEDEIMASLRQERQKATQRLSELRDRVRALDSDTRLDALRDDVLRIEKAAAAAGEKTEAARHAVSGMRENVAALEHEVAGLEHVDKDLGELSEDLRLAERDHDDWTRLQTAFGKKGIAKLEIDAAGPAISGLINDLLYSCFSSRFSARLQTQRATADGRMVEDFDIEITDTVGGWTGTIDDLSGGQKVVVAEAIGIAIAIYNKGDHPLETLFRDETTGALDPETAPLYVNMMRKAMKLGGFDRVIYITHNQECAEMADAVIRCADGMAVIE